MLKIVISKSALRNKGVLHKGQSYIVENRGKKEFVILPFSLELEKLIDEYKIIHTQEHIVENLKTTEKSEKSSCIIPKKNIKHAPGVGMWADREDMKNPCEYVQKIRKPRMFDA